MKLKRLKTSDTLLPILLFTMPGQLPGEILGEAGFSSVLGTSPGSVPGPTTSCKTSGKCTTSEIWLRLLPFLLALTVVPFQHIPTEHHLF